MWNIQKKLIGSKEPKRAKGTSPFILQFSESKQPGVYTPAYFPTQNYHPSQKIERKKGGQ